MAADKVIFCNCGTSGGEDSYIQKDLSSLGITNSGDWFCEFQVMIPQTTVDALGGFGDSYMADLIENGDGIFGTARPGDFGTVVAPFAWWTDRTSDPPSYSPGWDTYRWITLKVQKVSNTIQFTASGTVIFSYTGSSTNTTWQFGGKYASDEVGETYYVKAIKIGTTLGGTDILNENFASGLGAWTVFGDVTVIDDPLFNAEIAIIKSYTTVLSDEHGPITESGTVLTTTSLSASEHGPITEVITPPRTVTTPGGSETLYRDSATLAVKTTPSATDDSFMHPTGYWGPFDDDDGIIP